MKKIFIVLCTLFICVGCMTTKASDAVKEYLGKYNNHDSAILTELEEVIKEEKMTDEENEKYKDIMKKQYSDLKYEIVSEDYNGDEAIVKTKITVYDLYKAQKNAENYKTDHREEFIGDSGIYDSKLFLDYKLDEMKKISDRIEYTIDFKVNKKDNKWVLKSLTTEDLEKIHGIYNYTKD